MLCGPTFGTPTSSTQATEPPPAPMAVTPTTGIITGMPPICSAVLERGRPSSTTAMSALVPPTSSVITFGRPACVATYAAPITPDAGPESKVVTVCARAAVTGMMPPFDFVTCAVAGTPRAGSACSKPSR